MPAYRFYTLPLEDAPTPIVRNFFNDRVALLWAFRAQAQTGVEVWQGSRFVGRIHSGVRAEDSLAEPVAD